ncbi:uncharacterized protein VTP21DRAFT_7339 [Calcarisporiella thermophila]|uniref:uncharacterized protein n=1 Tax=Calcarisporiella thermophila TaxID=911321 RepID=UPI003742C069
MKDCNETRDIDTLIISDRDTDSVVVISDSDSKFPASPLNTQSHSRNQSRRGKKGKHNKPKMQDSIQHKTGDNVDWGNLEVHNNLETENIRTDNKSKKRPAAFPSQNIPPKTRRVETLSPDNSNKGKSSLQDKADTNTAITTSHEVSQATNSAIPTLKNVANKEQANEEWSKSLKKTASIASTDILNNSPQSSAPLEILPATHHIVIPTDDLSGRYQIRDRFFPHIIHILLEDAQRFIKSEELKLELKSFLLTPNCKPGPVLSKCDNWIFRCSLITILHESPIPKVSILCLDLQNERMEIALVDQPTVDMVKNSVTNKWDSAGEGFGGGVLLNRVMYVGFLRESVLSTGGIPRSKPAQRNTAETEFSNESLWAKAISIIEIPKCNMSTTSAIIHHSQSSLPYPTSEMQNQHAVGERGRIEHMTTDKLDVQARLELANKLSVTDEKLQNLDFSRSQSVPPSTTSMASPTIHSLSHKNNLDLPEILKFFDARVHEVEAQNIALKRQNSEILQRLDHIEERHSRQLAMRDIVAREMVREYDEKHERTVSMLRVLQHQNKRTDDLYRRRLAKHQKREEMENMRAEEDEEKFICQYGECRKDFETIDALHAHIVAEHVQF